MFLWIVGTVCVLLCLFSTAEDAVSLSPCLNQYFEVKEGETTNRLTCRGLTSQDTVNWFVKNSIAVGSCPPPSPGSSSDSCTPATGAFGAIFHPSRTSNAESVLNVDPVVHNSTAVERGGSLECRIAGGSGPFPSCQMDSVYPSEVGSCSVEFQRWSVVGSCSISKAYSAQGRYKCQWFQKTGSTETNFNLTNMTTSPLGGKYVRATCSLSASLPTAAGSYSYRVVVTPGSVGKDATATTTVIALPQSPTVSCSPTGYVPESSTLSCTCNTGTLGQPTGRLRWFWGTGNNINNNINNGNYGDTSLQMEPQKLVRGDDNRKKFRCDAEWARTVGGQVYTARVGYPPTGVTLQLTSGSQGATVSEGDAVTFACSGSGGRPTPNVTVVSKDSNEQLATGLSPLNHEENNVWCEDGGDYTCSADNRMGQPATTTATLYVNCKPRSSNTMISPANFRNQSVSVDFDVTAYPVPNSLTFAFLGASAANVSTPQTDYDGITLTGSCRQKGDKLYISTCIVTVDNMTSSAAAGFYQVTVANGQGQALFTVQIKYNAPEPPGNSPNTGGGIDAAAIGGGIVAAIVVIAVIVIAVIIVMRRRKGLNQKKPSSSFPAAHGGGTPDPVLPSPASSLSPLTDQPAAMAEDYAVVNKPKKKAAAASVANGGQPDTTYAVVDKTKKKLALPAVGAKPKPKKGKGKKDVAGHVYSNVELKPNKDKKGKKSAPPPSSPEESGTGREVNQDGLVYTAVDFRGAPLPSTAPSKPSPAEQGVVYSDVDFSKTAPTQ